MAVITAALHDQALIVENTPIIASGGTNEDKIQFAFDSSWEGYTKTAVFYRNKDSVFHQLVSSANAATVPQEVTKDSGVFYFGVFGVKGTEVKTSEVVMYRINAGAITTATATPSPTPDIYAQILAKIDDVYFLTKMQELNKGGVLQFWLGTNAEYNAITTPAENVLYIITDAATALYIRAAGGTGTTRWRIYDNGHFEVFRHLTITYDRTKFANITSGFLEGGYIGTAAVEWALSSMPDEIKNGTVNHIFTQLEDDGTHTAAIRKYNFITSVKEDAGTVTMNILAAANPGTTEGSTQKICLHISGTTQGA